MDNNIAISIDYCSKATAANTYCNISAFYRPFSIFTLCMAQKSDVSKNHICKYYRHTATTRKWVEDERQMLLSTWKIDKLQPLCYYHFIGNHITTAFMKGQNIEGMIESKLFNFVHFWLLCKPSYSYLDVYTNSLAE